MDWVPKAKELRFWNVMEIVEKDKTTQTELTKTVKGISNKDTANDTTE